MFSTAKEVHVYIEQAIQNASSNRKQSISPFFIDMVLNNAVLEYVGSKFPDKQSNRDIEATLKRYTDFNVLKKSTIKPLEVGTSLRPSVTTKIPSNCLKYQTGSVNYIRPIPKTFKTNKKKYSVLLSVDDSSSWGNTLTLSYKYGYNTNVISNSISFDDIFSNIRSKEGLFYLYDTIIDRLRNIADLDCVFESNDKNNNKVIRVTFPIGTTYIGNIFNLIESNSELITVTPIEEDVECIIDNVGRVSQLSLLSSFECSSMLDDYYGSKNLHLNPSCELLDKNLIIYYTDFIPTKVEINYIKKPRLFNITSGQIPEIDISKDFLDYAIKELLLILNSPVYTQVVNETIKNL